VYAYRSPEYVRDMGTPERYNTVQNDFGAGTITGKNLINPQKEGDARNERNANRNLHYAFKHLVVYLWVC